MVLSFEIIQLLVAMVFGMKSKAGATKATKPSPKKTAAVQPTPRSSTNNGAAAGRKKGLKKSSGVGASSSSTVGVSTGSGGSKQTKKTLGVKSTSSNSKLKTTTVTLKRSTGSMSTSRSANSRSSSRASSRASIASSIADDIEEREGADVREQEPAGSTREKSSVVQALEQELTAVPDGSGEANNDSNPAARNTVEEETAPYGGLEDKYALDDGVAEDPPLDPNALEEAKDDEEEGSCNEENVVDDDDTGDDAALNPTEATGDGHAVADRHHRSPKSPPSKARGNRRSSKEREHPKDRKEKTKSPKPRERTPRDHHHRNRHQARSPQSARPTSRTKSRNRPRRNDADRVDEYLKTRDTDAFDEDDDTYNPDAPSKSRFKKKMEEGVEEVHGTTQDILLSVFQVCCAFALRGKEINEFVREIDNARAELR